MIEQIKQWIEPIREILHKVIDIALIIIDTITPTQGL